jgi:tetratricopeptide (TPR) repeat protein
MQASDVISARFRLDAVAGSGAMGTVWRATDLDTGAQVAVKVLHTADPKLTERFVREAQILLQIQHPAVVRYVASGATAEGQRWLAMEWLDGEDLGARLLARRGLTVAESVELVRRAAEGLGAVHEAGIVHRDIKPSNLFLVGGQAAAAKLVDFGVARLTDQDARMTATGTALGTPAYMSPEQAAGKTQVGPAADVFALGSVLFECLTGRPAFQGDSLMEILGKVLFGEAPKLLDVRSDLPPALGQVLGRMMARDPAQRYPDGHAVAAALAVLRSLEGASPIAGVVGQVSLTQAEQRFLSIVVVGGRGGGASDATLDELDDRSTSQEILRAGRLFGMQVSTLADGAAVAVLKTPGIPTEQIERSARFALHIRGQLPDARIGLATGWGVPEDQATMNEVVSRAMAAITASTDHGVRIDPATASLLESRFEVAKGTDSVRLERERLASTSVRSVLGKPTECVGRVQELALLEATFGQCVEDGSAKMVLVTGPLGIGKSRLAHEFVLRAERTDEAPRVLRACADVLSAGASQGLIGELVRRGLLLTDQVLTGGCQAVGARAAEVLPADELDDTVPFLAELAGCGDRTRDNPRLQAARVDPALMVAHTQEAFTRLLAALCRRQPVVIVLDDLHLGDLPSLRTLDVAVRALQEQPLMVLGLGRPEVAERFPNLWRERDLTRLELGRLSRKACERLAQQVLGRDVAEARMAGLLDRADGNPYSLEELIRHIASGGDPASFPDSLLGVVHARLDALDLSARLVLRAASVFGQSFWHGGAVALSGGEERTVEVHDALERLVQAEFVRRHNESTLHDEVEYQFANALIRDAAYATLTEADRRVGHALALRWLQDRGERPGLVLARHAELADDRAQAAAFYLAAAGQAFEANDMTAVLARVDKGVQCGATGEVRGHLRLLEAEVHEWKGDWTAHEVAASEAMALLPEGAASWFRAAGTLVLSSARLGAGQGFEQLVARACVAVPSDASASGRKVIALCRGALSALWVGRYDLANGQVLAARQDAQGIVERDLLAAARLHHATAYGRLFRGETWRALEPFEAAAKAWDAAGDRRSRTGVRTNLGFALGLVGQYDEAEALLREQATVAGQLGLDFLRTVVEHNLGSVLAFRGRLDEGVAMKTAAVARLTGSGHPRLDGNLHASLAEVLLLAGRHAEAELEARRAVTLLPPFPPTAAYAHGVHAKALLELGRPEAAMAAAQAGMDILNRLGGIEEGEALLRLSWAEALAAVGRTDDASRAARQAVERLQVRAATLPDDHRRDMFLTQVAMHARTLDLARALTPTTAA